MAEIDTIRKILFIDNYNNIHDLIDFANTTGHMAFSHNSIIYVKDPSDCMNWIKTVFTLSDFEKC